VQEAKTPPEEHKASVLSLQVMQYIIKTAETPGIAVEVPGEPATPKSDQNTIPKDERKQ